MYGHLVSDFITLYAIFNPTGIIPSYIYYTRNEPRHALRGIAQRCILVASAILVTFIVIG
jgi:small neutral amino acid transporter SnatA (MarC family)